MGLRKHPDDLQCNELLNRKGGMGKGGWVVSSRSFDRLNSMMNDLKRSVDLRGLFDHRCSGLHKLWYPSIRDTSTWSKFGAHGEHGDVFLFSNIGKLSKTT